jgi:sugar lactone lactonase YvrE
LSFEFCAQPYYISTLAGTAGIAGASDGPAATARFNAPRGVASAPDGSVYVADTGNHTIRRIASDGTVTTVAGQAGVPGNNDGPATEAHLNSPSGLDINELGEVFIADTGNYVVRKLTTDGRLITIAGTPGVAGYADGPARTARFNGPIGLRLAGSSLYIADTANNAIRKLDFDPAEPRRRAARH